MDVLAQLARNTGYSVRVNHKVSTTAAASNKQGGVDLLNFGLDGSHNLVIHVSICCDHIGNSTVNNGHLIGKMQTNDYLQERTGVKNSRYKAGYAAVGMAFAPAIVSVADQIHPEFLLSCRFWLTRRRAKTKRSLAQRKRLAARLLRGIKLSRLVLTRTLLARPSLMPLPNAYTSLCTVQLHRLVVKLASPCLLLNA